MVCCKSLAALTGAPLLASLRLCACSRNNLAILVADYTRRGQLEQLLTESIIDFCSEPTLCSHVESVS